MKMLRWCLLFDLGVLLVIPVFGAEIHRPADKIAVLLLTGGHDFEKEPFFKVFRDNPEITFDAVEHPMACSRFKADASTNYQVIVMYDFNQPITDDEKSDFLARLKEGKGLVVLHHAIATYPEWPEYWKIIGARYYLKEAVVNGVEKARSGYKHDMDFRVHIADPNHPVTKGVKDFQLHDETYKGFDVSPECHPLLTTEEPESNPVIAWAKTYEAARVVYIQSGHDHAAYENPNFQRILRQAIRWTAKKQSVELN
jgi:uncharacterized protein